MATACFTGHRKINGHYYDVHNPSPEWNTLRTHMQTLVNGLTLDTYQVDHFISGLAIGVDMLAAEAVSFISLSQEHHIQLTGAMPFPSQASKWPAKTRAQWDNVCALCNEILSISSDPYHPSKMQIRNQWMVNQSDYVVAVWNGIKSGGTWDCIHFALSQQKPVLVNRLDPDVLFWSCYWLTEIP